MASPPPPPPPLSHVFVKAFLQSVERNSDFHTVPPPSRQRSHCHSWKWATPVLIIEQMLAFVTAAERAEIIIIITIIKAPVNKRTNAPETSSIACTGPATRLVFACIGGIDFNTIRAIPVRFGLTHYLFFLNRETEYKGLQLSLDQAASNKPAFTYNSPTSTLSDSRKASKSRVTRTKAKTRLSPYSNVSAFVLFYSHAIWTKVTRHLVELWHCVSGAMFARR